MIFLLLSVFIGVKLVSYCRRCGKSEDEMPEDITMKEVKKKLWFKTLVVVRMILLVVFGVLGYYWYFILPHKYAWMNQGASSWGRHFQSADQRLHQVCAIQTLNCTASFKSSIEENFEVAVNYSYGFPNSCLNNLHLSDSATAKLVQRCQNPSKDPLLVTAVFDENFNETLGLLHNVKDVLLKSKFKTSVMLFNFGLTQQQLALIQNFTFVMIKPYPFKKLSSCLKPLWNPSVKCRGETFSHSYNSAYKPAMIQLALVEHDFVIWMDSNIRFQKSFSLDKLSSEVRETSFKIQNHASNKTSDEFLLEHLFTVIREEPCLFRDQNMLDTSLLFIHRNNFTLNAIMKPWVSATFKYAQYLHTQKKFKAVLHERNSNNNFVANVDNTGQNVDSSMLNVLLTRIFNDKKHLFMADIDTVSREIITAKFSSNQAAINSALMNSSLDVTISSVSNSPVVGTGLEVITSPLVGSNTEETTNPELTTDQIRTNISLSTKNQAPTATPGVITSITRPKVSYNPRVTVSTKVTINTEETNSLELITSPTGTDNPTLTNDPVLTATSGVTSSPRLTTNTKVTINAKVTTNPEKANNPELSTSLKGTNSPKLTNNPALNASPSATTRPKEPSNPRMTTSTKLTINAKVTTHPEETTNSEPITTGPKETNNPILTNNPVLTATSRITTHPKEPSNPLMTTSTKMIIDQVSAIFPTSNN